MVARILSTIGMLVFAGSAYAAESVHLTVDLKMQEKSANSNDEKRIKTSLNVPYGQATVLGGAGKVVTQIEVTPTLTPEGHVQCEFKILRDGNELSKQKVTIALGQSAKIATEGENRKIELD